MASDSSIHTLVIGAGNWGTALASTAALTGPTLLLARNQAIAEGINNQGINPVYLSDISLPSTLKSTLDVDEALRFLSHPQALIILAVPVLALRATCRQWFQLLVGHQLTHIPIVWTCKGFEENTRLLPHEVVQEVLAEPFFAQPLADAKNQSSAQSSQADADLLFSYGVLSGPSFADEVARYLPVALTVASHSPLVISRCIAVLHTQNCRLYSNQDIIGVEIGGALKNVIAIACGISDGLNFGLNARAALITRGLAEIMRLGVALGGQTETFAGLTGLGDLVLTTTGDLSRNRQVGLAIGRGQTLEQILATGLTAEGVRCSRAALARAQALNIEMPITSAVCEVLFNNMLATEAVQLLLAREVKGEVLIL